MRKYFSWLLISLTVSSSAFAVTALTRNLQVPLSLFGHSQSLQAQLPETFQVLVWNVHKGSDEKLPADFSALSRFSSLVLFQEAIDQEIWTNKIARENTDLAWSLAQSFETSGYYTGVATGAHITATQRMGYRTQKTEPVTNTPKTMLLSEYTLNNGQTLRVLNVHGINFVMNSDFYLQVNQIVNLVKNHPGALLVAGDFNTWNGDRTNYLLKSFKAIGLNQVKLQKHGLLELDHVFVRGLRVVRAQVHPEINSSDHKPITVELQSLSSTQR